MSEFSIDTHKSRNSDTCANCIMSEYDNRKGKLWCRKYSRWVEPERVCGMYDKFNK